MNNPKVFVPAQGVESWRALLANPLTQWRAGYSAMATAQSWEAQDGLPPEIAAHFEPDAELILAIPEHKVPMPGRGADSQNDVFALVREGGVRYAVAVEGKVNESFDRTIDEWWEDAPSQKPARLAGLADILGLRMPIDGAIRYQLLHRTASAILEADRFGAERAAMIVQSFSSEKRWYEDFEAFCALFGVSPDEKGRAVTLLPDGRELMFAWAQGDPKFLSIAQ